MLFTLLSVIRCQWKRNPEVHMYTRPHARTHTHIHTRARTHTHTHAAYNASAYFCQWYVVCCLATQGTPPQAPPSAPTQGASAQYTVPGSGARVTVRTIPVGGDRIDQGAMEQLTQVSERRGEEGGEGRRG